MKLRILNFHVNALHDRISAINTIADPVAITDYDAFIYDPFGGLMTPGTSSTDIDRRKRELRDLIQKKGGIVICILRPDQFNDWALDDAAPALSNFIRTNTRPGTGSQFKVLPAAKGLTVGYFQVLKGCISFTAHLEVPEPAIAAQGGTAIAVNSVGYPVAAEFVVGEARVCFVPPPTNIPADRMGAAIIKVVSAHFNKTGQVDAPLWAAEISVPGADIHDAQIAELTKQAEELTARIVNLKGDRDRLLSYVQMLFGYGKAVLEPVVRAALRVFGFAVPDPEEYEGEWDVELRDVSSGQTALGEVEGSEGVVDVDKYRQLLDYIEAESQEGRDHKGILIGNGFRLLDPDAPERKAQFSEHAQRGAARNHFCLLPATELFKAVCAVLESPTDESLKTTIRSSLLATTGQWSFARETMPESKPEAAKGATSPTAAPSAVRPEGG